MDTQDDGPWTQGYVSCEHCGHRWVSVRPVAATVLECPHCHEMSDGSKGMRPKKETP